LTFDVATTTYLFQQGYPLPRDFRLNVARDQLCSDTVPVINFTLGPLLDSRMVRNTHQFVFF